MNLDLEDWIQQQLYFLDTYEEAELKFLEDSLNNGDTFIDIGANVGLYSFVASRIVGLKGNVIAFEPFAANTLNFQENKALNDFQNIELIQKAVAEHNSEMTLHYNQSEANLGMASAFIKDFTHSQKVTAISLDNFLETNTIQQLNFIKLDIEGGEFNALKGMKNTLIKYQPILLVELLDEAYTHENKAKVTAFLEDLGYQKWYIQDDGSLSANNDLKRINYAFVHVNKQKKQPN